MGKSAGVTILLKELFGIVQQIYDDFEKVSIASKILGALPEWFGLPESTKAYIDGCGDKPFWAAFAENKPVGFITLKETSLATAEVFVMGVLPEYHRAGVGRELYGAFEFYARGNGYSYVQVKTVQMGRYPSYDKTNCFYQAMGFRELECFPSLWDEWNPCQIYVKYIGNSDEISRISEEA